MSERPWQILILCNDNAARSILAEALMNALGGHRVRAVSAGYQPSGVINPYTLSLLEEQGIESDHLQSKNWAEFATADAMPLDMIISLSELPTQNTPSWPGQPIQTHWAILDPIADATLSQVRPEDIPKVFMQVYALLTERILNFLSLSFEELERGELQKHLDEIARVGAAAAIPDLLEMVGIDDDEDDEWLGS